MHEEKFASFSTQCNAMALADREHGKEDCPMIKFFYHNNS